MYSKKDLKIDNNIVYIDKNDIIVYQNMDTTESYNNRINKRKINLSINTVKSISNANSINLSCEKNMSTSERYDDLKIIIDRIEDISSTKASKSRIANVNPIYQKVGSRFAAIRNARGFTQRQIATKLDLSLDTIIAYENGEMRINAMDLYEISQILNAPVSLFFNDEISSKPKKVNATKISQQKKALNLADKISVDEKDMLDHLKNFMRLKPSDRKNIANLTRMMDVPKDFIAIRKTKLQ